uniref:Uncharacterized protein n=1 Tax=Nelumbo nucifera TaxID=4432 RepID=A0A822ZJ25_NELNU|nr:TPA_asm: hypothetical protein HUJ06_003107 [Nelumbo nucifera]
MLNMSFSNWAQVMAVVSAGNGVRSHQTDHQSSIMQQLQSLQSIWFVENPQKIEKRDR